MKATPEHLEPKQIPAPARTLAAEAIGIDCHMDTVQRVLVMGEDLEATVLQLRCRAAKEQDVLKHAARQRDGGAVSTGSRGKVQVRQRGR